MRGRSSSYPQIRVVIVDDSRLMRNLLCAAIEQAPDLAVAGFAADPFEARDVIRATNPDVVTLDIEMPRMDGLEFLRRIMALRPTPVVMVSSATTAGADATLSALEIGAVDFVQKPQRDGWPAFGETLRQKLRAAAKVRPNGPRPTASPLAPCAEHGVAPDHDVVAIGASTGGVAALNRLFAELPRCAPPVLVTQHMPPEFTGRLAARLARTLSRDVAEAADGEALVSGMIRIAPGDRHLQLDRRGGRLASALSDGPPVSGHRPSVDVLFRSVAETAGRRAVGVILTGMGRDGAVGLRAMREAGAATFGESVETCVVYGMSRVARAAGAVATELPLDRMAAGIVAALSGAERPSRIPRQTEGPLHARR